MDATGVLPPGLPAIIEFKWLVGYNETLLNQGGRPWQQ
jgi:hypothetical protein